MAVDRLGNTIATGQVYALAGTVRFVDGDNVVVVVGERGEQVIRCKAADIVKVDAPTAPEYVLKSANAAAPSGRVLVNSIAIEWNWTVAGYVAAEIPAGYVALLALIYQPRNSFLDYISTYGVDSNMIVDGSIALGDLANLSGPGYIGRGSAGSGAPALIGMSTPTRVAPTMTDVFHKFKGSTGAIERCTWEDMLEAVGTHFGLTPP